MKSLFAGLLLLILFAFPAPAGAVSFPPEGEHGAEQSVKTPMTAGAVICLFQSGTPDVKKEIHVSDVLAVYREDRKGVRQKVGSILILAYPGRDYLKAVVLDGILKDGDIAMKGEAAGLVTSSGSRCPD